MPEIDEEITVQIDRSRISFETKNKKHDIIIRSVNLTQQQACALTWLLNNGPMLEFQIKMAT